MLVELLDLIGIRVRVMVRVWVGVGSGMLIRGMAL